MSAKVSGGAAGGGAGDGAVAADSATRSVAVAGSPVIIRLKRSSCPLTNASDPSNSSRTPSVIETRALASLMAHKHRAGARDFGRKLHTFRAFEVEFAASQGEFPCADC